MAERHALITGCSSGFGLGIARGLAARGWLVHAGLRNPARVPAELEAIGKRLQVLPLDLLDVAQIEAAAAGIERLDCLVNNAGYALNGPFVTYGAAQMQRQMQVNLLGPALLAQRLLPALAAARGRVINVSSVAGETGMPMNSFYSASKFALEGWSESLSHEWHAYGIQVALVEPGGFRTRFGGNIEWGDASADAVAISQIAGLRALQARLLAGPGNDPQAVVDAVLGLAEIAAMPLRTRVGRDARTLHWLRRLLPEGLLIRLVGALFRRRLGEPER